MTLLLLLYALAAFQVPDMLGQPPGDPLVLMAARPNPYNRGNCFQWKKCLGETIGNMWVDAPEFCGPLGGKSWKGLDGACVDLLETPWSVDPRSMPGPPGPS